MNVYHASAKVYHATAKVHYANAKTYHVRLDRPRWNTKGTVTWFCFQKKKKKGVCAEEQQLGRRKKNLEEDGGGVRENTSVVGLETLSVVTKPWTSDHSDHLEVSDRELKKTHSTMFLERTGIWHRWIKQTNTPTVSLATVRKFEKDGEEHRLDRSDNKLRHYHIFRKA